MWMLPKDAAFCVYKPYSVTGLASNRIKGYFYDIGQNSTPLCHCKMVNNIVYDIF